MQVASRVSPLFSHALAMHSSGQPRRRVARARMSELGALFFRRRMGSSR